MECETERSFIHYSALVLFGARKSFIGIGSPSTFKVNTILDGWTRGLDPIRYMTNLRASLPDGHLSFRCSLIQIKMDPHLMWLLALGLCPCIRRTIPSAGHRSQRAPVWQWIWGTITSERLPRSDPKLNPCIALIHLYIGPGNSFRGDLRADQRNREIMRYTALQTKLPLSPLTIVVITQVILRLQTFLSFTLSRTEKDTQ